MQAVQATDKQVADRTDRYKAKTPSGEFDSLMMIARSAQIASFSDALIDASGLNMRGSEDQLSSRRSRINQQVASSRQAEIDSYASRRADPSSVQNGVVSSRHERVLAGREDSARSVVENQKQQEQPNLESDKSLLKSEEKITLNTKVNGENTKEAVSNQVKETVTATKSETPADTRVKPESSDSPSQGKSENKGVISVSTAGAARQAAIQSGQAEASRVTPAKTVGQILSARSGGEMKASAGEIQPGTEASKNSRSEAPGSRKPSTAADSENTRKPTSENIRRSEFNRLINQVRLNRGTRTSSATIRLDPPNMGKLKVDVRMVNDVLSVRIETAKPEARQVLQERADELLAALKEHRIEVDKFEVVHKDGQVMDQTPDDPDGKTDGGRESGTNDATGNEAEDGQYEERDMSQRLLSTDEVESRRPFARMADDVLLDVSG